MFAGASRGASELGLEETYKAEDGDCWNEEQHHEDEEEESIKDLGDPRPLGLPSSARSAGDCHWQFDARPSVVFRRTLVAFRIGLSFCRRDGVILVVACDHV